MVGRRADSKGIAFSYRVWSKLQITGHKFRTTELGVFAQAIIILHRQHERAGGSFHHKLKVLVPNGVELVILARDHVRQARQGGMRLVAYNDSSPLLDALAFMEDN